MYVCIKTKEHIYFNDDYFKSNKETQFVGFGEMDELNELVESDIKMWIKAYKEFAISGWMEFDKITNFKGETCRIVDIYYRGRESHHITLTYVFIEQSKKMFYID